MRYGGVALLVLLALGAALWSADVLGPDRDPNPGPSTLGPGEGTLEARGGPGVALEGRAPHAGIDPQTPDDALPSSIDLEAARKRGDIHGIVVDGDRRPIAGAALALRRRPWKRVGLFDSTSSKDVSIEAETRSARDGHFTLPVAPGYAFDLQVTRAGYASIERRDARGGMFLRLVLTPGAEVRVRVVNTADRVIPGALVRLGVSVRDQEVSDAIGMTFRETTGEDGVARFVHVPSNAQVIVRVLDPSSGRPQWIHDAPTTKEGATHELSVVIGPGRTIHGTVKDAETDAPIAGARVGAGWSFEWEVRTDADGRYEIGGFGNWPREIHVLAPGYARSEVWIGSGSEGVFDIRLHRGVRIRGRVAGPNGQGVVGAKVVAVGTLSTGPGGMTFSSGSTTTDASGRFLVPDLRRDLPHLLLVLDPRYGKHATELDAAGDQRAEIEVGTIRLYASHRIEGRVTEADGTPRPYLPVSLSGSNSDIGRLRPENAPLLGLHYGRRESQHTDASGRFAFAGLPPGTYVLQAGRTGDSMSRRVTVKRGAFVTRVPLRFQPQREFVIEVVHADGTPVPHIDLWIEPTGGEERHLITDAQGRATTRLLGSIASVKVSVIHESEAGERAYVLPKPAQVDPARGVHRIVLEPALVIAGILRGPDGKPLAQATLTAERDGKAVAYASADEKGRFRFNLKRALAVDLRYRGERWGMSDGGEFRIWREPLEGRLPKIAPPASNVVVRARAVEANAALQLEIRDESGRAVAGAHVRITPAPQGDPGTRLSDKEGRVSFPNMTTNPVKLAVRPPMGRAHELAPSGLEEATPGATVHRIVLRTPIFLDGRTVDTKGEPVSGVTVRARGAFLGSPAETVSDADGRFRIPLPPGVEGQLNVWAVRSEKGNLTLGADISGVDPRGPAIVLELVYEGD